MKNIQKFIIEKVFWWTGITDKNDEEFLASFMIGLSLIFKLLFLTLIALLMWFLIVYYAVFGYQASQLEYIGVIYLSILFILFLKLVLFAFFYKDMIDYQNNRIQELIPEYDPKLNLDDKDLLRDAIKDAMKIEGVKDDEFVEVVRALFLQKLKEKNILLESQRKEINKIINHIAEEKQ